MSAQTDRLAAISIRDPYAYAVAAGGNAPYITYRAAGPHLPAGWRVEDIELNSEFFPNHRHGGRAGALAAAQEWAGTRYGITAWKRTPFGTYMAAEHVDTMAKRVKPLTHTQALILANVRDDGDPFYGRHGSPHGQAQHGGWNGALYALADLGLVQFSHRTAEVTVTAAGLARLDAEVRS